MLAFAQTVQSILGTLGGLINMVTIIIVALALLAFLWGLTKWLFGGVEDKDAGRQMMIYGVIALFVMVAVWGLVQVLANTFGVGTGGTAPIPGVIGSGFGGTSGSINVGVNSGSGSFWGSLPI